MKRFQEFRGGLYRVEYDPKQHEFVSIPVDFPFPGTDEQQPAASRKPRAKLMALKIDGRKPIRSRKPAK